MFLILDGTGPQYAQLSRAMKAAILDGRIGIGSRLAPTRELAQDLGLSRTTVLAAYEQLRAEGFADFPAYARSLAEKFPLQLAGEPVPRLRSGALCLNDPAEAQVCLALFQASRELDPLL